MNQINKRQVRNWYNKYSSIKITITKESEFLLYIQPTPSPGSRDIVSFTLESLRLLSSIRYRRDEERQNQLREFDRR